MTNTCTGCGTCCRLFLINLNQKEYESGKFRTILQEQGVVKNFALARSCGANLLAQNTNGSCLYLKNNQCSIHSRRPQACHNFFCTSHAKKFAGMIRIIKQHDL